MSRAAGDAERVAIEGELTIYQASEWVARLQHALYRVDALTIDLAGVTEIDTAGVQVLALTRREAALRDRTVFFDAHSPAVLEVFCLLGVDAQLECALKPWERP
ncbi:sulfate transporter [Pigmentiphaga litoralis]|jgi:anti-anti-sigma regulatory factor|uniref:STAS domain-containing protein n=1 Tax=Pigmentiphaga litoralis TaxID=516702 RepID=UPI00167728CD|nr:STAS domain-containing protein [Pigmentiphaga litoralis]GGX12882.1 sulfate transporter [Pigmentiphaga litoralis]